MKKFFLALFFVFSGLLSLSAFAKPGDVISTWGSVDSKDMHACDWSLNDLKNQAQILAYDSAKKICGSDVKLVSDFTYMIQCPDDAFPWASVVARANFQCE